jgi:hypothetical protein
VAFFFFTSGCFFGGILAISLRFPNLQKTSIKTETNRAEFGGGGGGGLFRTQSRLKSQIDRRFITTEKEEGQSKRLEQ